MDAFNEGLIEQIVNSNIENLEQIEDTLVRISKEEVKKEAEMTLEQLHYAAKVFLKEVDTCIHIQNQFSIYKTTGKLKVSFTKLYNKMKTDEKVTQRLVSAMQNFQIAKNRFNNVTMVLAYIDIDENKIVLSTQENMATFLKKYATVSSKGGRGNVTIGKNRQEELNNGLNEYWKHLENLLNQNSKKYYGILEQTLRRWHNKEMFYKKKEPKKYNNTFYWRPYLPHFTYIHWSRSYGSRGPIGEGYMAALMQEAFHQGSLEDNISILNDYTDKTDNIGASKMQDIVFNFNNNRMNNIQIAVKSGQFSTPRIGQYIQQAIEIILIEKLGQNNFLTDKVNFKKMTKDMTKKELQKALTQRKRSVQEIFRQLRRQNFELTI